jgi:hypothetical protein
VLGRQRAQLRRSTRHKAFVGQDAGEAAGRASEREKVKRMQRDAATRSHAAEVRARQSEPLSSIVVDLVADTLRLTRTLVGLPFRLLLALRSGWNAGALRGEAAPGAQA